jgi:signal transduction histidine kinase
MTDVSCRALGVLLKAARRREVADSLLLDGVRYDLAYLRNTKHRIEWSAFCRILDNSRSIWSLQDLSDLNESFMRSPFVSYVSVVARLLFSARDLYDWICKRSVGGGAQLFAQCVRPSYEHIGNDVTVIRLEIPQPYVVSPEFFWMTRGTFIAMPRLVGAGSAQVDMTIEDRLGTYHVRYKSRRGTLASVVRFLTWPFTARAAARELKDAHETLVERYLEIEDARSKLDRQATQLRTAHAVNDLVQRDLDLVRTLDTVAKALVDQAGFAWAEIVLRATDPSDPSTVRAARFGADHHEPPLERALEARGGEVIGDLRIATRPGANREEREELIAFIAPTLAMALQNAISYQALADYRSGLERLVDQRTSELRQARDQLAGTVAELREAQGARERFFGNITHEIRTPLSLILLAAADVETRAGALLDQRSHRSLTAVTDAAHKLVRLVDELLLLAASQEDKLRTAPERTDVAALIGALVAAWRPAAEAAGLELHSNQDEDRGATSGPVTRATAALLANVDPVAFERVASNLLSNAIKYTPRGGTVTVELVEQPDGLRLSVFDTGQGIDEDLRGRLFGRFERATRERHRKAGTGLGLFVAKQLVEAHGGTIAALPRDAGPGSELRVMLPPGVVIRDAEQRSAPVVQLHLAAVPADPTEPMTRFTPGGYSGGTILLAEDDVRLAEMIGRLLADEYTVIIAHDGATALELIAQHQPQLLITDVDMPLINGIDLARRFRELTGDRLAPIIVVSAILDLGTRVAGLEAGAVDYVTKPFDPLELRARIRSQFRMRELAVRLQRAEQLSALGILTAGLAHELRNPANAIVNAVGPLIELLPSELVRPETAIGQLLEVLTGCAEQVGFLSRQLLGFRKGVVELDLRPVPVRELVQRAVSLVHAGGVEVRLDFRSEGALRCAPPLLIQVLINLVENAIYAASSDGWVQIRTDANENRLSIEITDSGPGVPSQLRERVFEPFFTTKPTGVGTGLGLSLARDIAHRHGGVLEIRDRGDRACFVLELPNYSALDGVAQGCMIAAPRLR